MLLRAFGDGVRSRTIISDFGDGMGGSSSSFRRLSGADGSFGEGDRERRYHFDGSLDTVITSSLSFVCSSGEGWLLDKLSAGDGAFPGDLGLCCLDQCSLAGRFRGILGRTAGSDRTLISDFEAGASTSVIDFPDESSGVDGLESISTGIFCDKLAFC